MHQQYHGCPWPWRLSLRFGDCPVCDAIRHSNWRSSAHYYRYQRTYYHPDDQPTPRVVADPPDGTRVRLYFPGHRHVLAPSRSQAACRHYQEVRYRQSPRSQPLMAPAVHGSHLPSPTACSRPGLPAVRPLAAQPSACLWRRGYRALAHT
jgi:hypothetical protein